MKVYFSHGKESGPWGSKITQLAYLTRNLGFKVDSIDYTQTENPDDRVAILASIIGAETESVILVGSSMGGYVSLVVAETHPLEGLFLLAPAVYMPGYEVQEFTPKSNCTEIVHGWSDDVIPPDNSIRFAMSIDSTLHLISGDHRLNSSIETVESIYSGFLNKCLKGSSEARVSKLTGSSEL